MNAASIHTLPSSQDRVTVSLTADEAVVVAAYALASSVSAFGMADRAESACMMERADECRRDAITLSKVEIKIRNAIRSASL